MQYIPVCDFGGVRGAVYLLLPGFGRIDMKFMPAERLGFHIQDIDFSVLEIRSALLILIGVFYIPGSKATQQGLKKDLFVMGKQVARPLAVEVFRVKQRNQAAVLDLEQAEALLRLFLPRKRKKSNTAQRATAEASRRHNHPMGR